MTDSPAPGPLTGDPAELGVYLPEELEELLDSLDPNPALVVGPAWAVLGANRSARSLFKDWSVASRGAERNLLWFYCCDPAARTLFVDWEAEAADQVALFRLAAEKHPGEARYARVRDRVIAANPKVESWWQNELAAPNRGRSKRIRLANGQVVVLRQLMMQVIDDPEIHVVCYFSGIDEDDDGDLA